MTTSKTILMVVAEADKLPRLSPNMEGMKRDGRCDFCNCRVVYNRNNYREQQSKGLTPVLCCVGCYRNGNHIHQGFRG